MGSFVHPSFLIWLAPMAAVPIILHLLNRRRYRNLSWAAMRFLEAAYKRTNRRIRLENLLLLLLRVALMVLLVLALSRPVVTRGSALAILGQERRNLVLAIDTSYSMQYRSGLSETNFDRARRIAKRILGDLKPRRGDTLTLLAMGEEPEVLEERSVWIEKGLEDLTRLEADSGSVDLEAALGRILEICDHPEMRTHTEIFLLGDFQRRDWVADDDDRAREPDAAAPAAPAGPAPPAARLRDLLADLGRRRIPVRLVDVGSDRAENLAVTRLAVEDKAVGIRRPVRLDAEVTNRGYDLAGGSVSLWVGPNKVATSPVGRLSPGETTVLSFYHTFGKPGDAGIRAQIDPEVKDRLSFDDTRYLALDILDRIRVLVVDGDPGGEGLLDSETGYLKLALDPSFGSASEIPSLFSIEEAFDYDLGLKVFSEYDWIAIANLREMPEAKARELVAAVRSGVGLLLFLGDQVDPAFYNARFFGAGSDRLLPGRLAAASPPLDAAASWKFTVEDFRHPVLRFFEDETIRPLLVQIPRTRGFLRYEPGEAAEGLRILARYNDPADSPALVAWTAGRGRVLLCTTSANDAWTSLPRTHGFLPFVQEIGTWLAARDRRRTNLLAGEPLALDLPRYAAGAWIELPAGQKEEAKVQAVPGDESRFLLRFSDTRRPGVYRIGGLGQGSAPSPEPRGNGERLFAVNVDPAEGDLHRIGADEIRRRFPEFPFQWSRDYLEPSQRRRTRREGEIWKYLLGAVVALLLLEGALAQLFGDYTRR